MGRITVQLIKGIALGQLSGTIETERGGTVVGRLLLGIVMQKTRGLHAGTEKMKNLPYHYLTFSAGLSDSSLHHLRLMVRFVLPNCISILIVI